ncbi:MAG: type II secretion system F family protein [Candidatus Riflebacteria bacterium]|nr:type II secretion system F family protein [Candidatus Riflebacteria bacterium]
MNHNDGSKFIDDPFRKYPPMVERYHDMLSQAALGLVCGMSLPEVAGQMGSTGAGPCAKAFAFLARGLENGTPLQGLLGASPCLALPRWLLALIGSELDDSEIGAIMAARLNSDYYGFDTSDGKVFYIAVLIAITGLNLTAMVMFILPQFKEIFLGMHLEIPWSMQLILESSDFLINWWFIVILLFAIISTFGKQILDKIGRVLFSSYFFGPEIVVALSSLAAVPPDRVRDVMSVLAHPLFLPRSHAIFSELAMGIDHGTPTETILARHGLDPLEAWLIRLGIDTGESRDLFEQAADLLRFRLKHRFNRLREGIETAAIVLTATFVGIICSSLYLALVRLLTEIIYE